MGENAIGVIRVSGPAAPAVVSRVLRSAAPLDEFPSHALCRVVRLLAAASLGDAVAVSALTGDGLDALACARASAEAACLSDILGIEVGDAVLNRIFSTVRLGK